MNVDKRRFVIYLCKKSLARLFKTKLTAHLVSLHFFQCVFNCIVIPDYFCFLFFFSCRLLNRVPAGPAFISLCFVVRSVDAVGFAAAMTSTFAMTAKIFPNNVATVLVSADKSCAIGMLFWTRESRENKQKKSIIVPDVLYVPFLPVPWKINNLSLFRVVWRFSQDLVLFWDRRSEGGCTSHLDMKSLLCFLDVSYWLWFLSTYTSCQPLVVVGDFSILFVHIQSF